MSFPSYESYKNVSVEGLTKIPQHWSVVPCRAIVSNCEAKNEGAHNQNYLSLMANVGIIPYEEKGDVGNKKPDDLQKCKLVKVGNLVINSMNYSIGSYGMSNYDGVCSPVYIVLDINVEKVLPRFALRVFENRDFQRRIASFGNGILAHRAAIGWDDIKGTYIALPPKEDQSKILEFLDIETSRIDTLVAEQKRLIELLNEKRLAVISHAVTKGINPRSAVKPSGIDWLGNVPNHWDVKPLKYLVTLKSGGTPSKDKLEFWDGDIPWASAKDLKMEELHDTIDHLSDEAIRVGAASLNPPGTILVLVRGMMLARAFPVVTTAVPMAINQDLKAVTPLSQITASFLAWYFRGTSQQSLDRCDEAGHGTKALRMDAWLSLPVAVPPPAEQEKIVLYLARITKKIDLLVASAENVIDILHERRAALISAAVTGKIDVRGWFKKQKLEAA